MPRKVLEGLVAELTLDIRGRHRVGDRFLTVREIAGRHGVSLQTAHKALRRLVDDGVLSTSRGAGTTVLSTVGLEPALEGRKVLLLSNNPDPRFNQAFRRGVETALVPLRMGCALQVNKEENTESLGFGEALLDSCRSLHAAGVVAVFFRRAELAFYHLLQNGVPLVADIALDNLPVLPSVQTDNARHSREAARRFLRWGRTEVLAAGFWDPRCTRFEAFREELLRLDRGATVTHLRLNDPDFPARLHLFFEGANERKGVFSLDYAANYVLAPCFATWGLDPSRCFLVYDSEGGSFRHPGLPEVESVGPSMEALGRRLAEKLIHKLRTGVFMEPLAERL